MTSHEIDLLKVWNTPSGFHRTGADTRAVCQRQGNGYYWCGKCLADLNCDIYRELDLGTVAFISEVPI